MERRIIRTADGSATLQIPEWQEQYHSIHGALQESLHVFINSGLRCFQKRKIALLEVGFGTGLNALLTCLEAPELELTIEYTGLELYPVTAPEWEALDYGNLFPESYASETFIALHRASWETSVPVTPFLTLYKRNQDFRQVQDVNAYDLIYFDAFGARVQPELWTEALFERMFKALRLGGCLVTYAAKGSVRRAMQAVGFRVERLSGPPGKREMLRAWKEDNSAMT